MGAWTQVGTGTSVAITAGAGNQTVSLPGTPKRGDLVIVAVAGDISCQNSVATSGYTAAENGTGANPGAYLAYKVLTAAETGVDIVRDGTILKSCVVQVWSGCDPVSPVDVAYGGEASGTSANPNATAITVVSTGALVFQIAWLDDDDTTVSSYPSTYTNGISANTGQTSTTVGSTVAICSLTRDAGSEDAGQWTMGTSDAWQAGAIGFKVQAAIAPTQTKADVAITGYVPTVTLPVSRTPTVGAVEIAGYAPVVSVGKSFAPAVGAASITGYAPSLSVNVLRSPAAGAAAITGYAPLVQRVNSWAARYAPGTNAWFPRFETGAKAITQTAGSVAIEGYAPGVVDSGAGAVTREPTVGALAITGYAPALTQQQQSAPTVGALALTGYAPSLAVNVPLAPSVAALSVTGYAPTVNVSYTFAPAVGAVAITGYAPTPQITDANSPTFYPSVADPSITGYAPLVGISYSLAPTVGAATITGYAPLVGQSLVAVPAVGALALTGYAPSVAKSERFAPAAGALALTGYAPTIAVEAGSRVFTPATAQLGVEGHAPQVVDGGIRIVTFPFLANAQGFVATPGAGTTMAWTGADGNPLGSLQSATTGKNRNATNLWTLTTDWASLGVPANKVITSITAKSAQSRVTTYTTAAAGGSVSAVILTPTGQPAVTIAAARTITGTNATWQTETSANSTGLEIPSGGSLTITLGSNLRTGNSTSANVTLRQDNVTFTVTYTAAKNLRPEGRTLTITGYAPVIVATVPVNSWFRRLTDGANTWAQRNNVGPTQEVFPTSGALGITGYAPSLDFGSPTIAVPGATLGITGYEPGIIGEPLVLLGSDTLYSGLATIVATDGVRVVQQGDFVERPTVGALSITGYAPALRLDYRYSPRTNLAITGYAPGVGRNYAVAPDAGALAIVGYAPDVALGSPSFAIPVAAVGITGYAPALSRSDRRFIEPTVAGLAIRGYAPASLISVQLAPTVGAVAIVGYAPAVENTRRITVAAATLGVDGFIPSLPKRISAALASGVASLAGSGGIVRNASGALQSPQPLAFVATGGRIATGSGTLNSGPASLKGNAYPVVGVLASADARLFGRATVVPYDPLHARLKPVRVNRYTVALKPKPRYRIKRPNTRKPMR